MSEQNTLAEPRKIAIVTGEAAHRPQPRSRAWPGAESLQSSHTTAGTRSAEAVVAAVKQAGAEAIALQLDAGNVASFADFVERVKRSSLQTRSHAL